MKNIRELYDYREMLYNLVRRDLRTRYRASFLGFLWTFINPLMMLVIYSFVFSFIFGVKEDNYAMFLFVNLLPWTFFSTSLISSTTSVVGGSNLIKKVYFPRMVLPIACVVSNLINYIYGMGIVLAALVITKIYFSVYILYFPLVVLVLFLLTTGICLFLSSLTVFFRDLEHLTGIFTMAWFYITPIVFKIDNVPEELRGYMYLNPVTPIMIAVRDILYYKKAPDLIPLWWVLGLSIVLIVTGTIVFNILQKSFIEEI